MKFELNEQFKKALDILENTSANIFITGKAGTGKSTLLNYFRLITKKEIVILAPTGVAALNVSGETIHSFFGFKPNISKDKIKKVRGKRGEVFKAIDAIIIDEISMCRADLLDCIDTFLRLNGPKRTKPFGGVQMVFIGDLYQLPPVVSFNEKELFKSYYLSPYFFSSHVFENFSMEFIELEKVYRQKDNVFIDLLNSIRNNTINEKGLKLLNNRLGAVLTDSSDGCAICLTTTNKMAYDINMEHLLKSKAKIISYSAKVSGNFSEQAYPTDKCLELAVGAQVMLLNNDAKDRWVNGSIGKITAICSDTKGDVIEVKLVSGKTVEVIPFSWEIFHFGWNSETKTIDTETVGSFLQYPLKLAWAITIHKSQGKTFSQVVIDMGNGAFAHGQTYVALSRCTHLEGISLAKPIKKSHIFSDWRIVDFVTKYQYKISDSSMPLKDKITMINQAIKDNLQLEITYLKNTDEKTKRIVKPRQVGEMFYKDKSFIGLRGHCFARKEERTFRLDRILEMTVGLFENVGCLAI